MKYLIGFLVAGLVLITGCVSPQPASTFPPPSGYASWDEYNNQHPGQASKTTSTSTSLPSKTSPVKVAPTFVPIIITGSGDKTSPPFTVTTSEWIIDWSFSASEPGYAVFGFFVYPRGETAMYVESVLFPSTSSGTTYSYAGPGDYYVKISAGNINSWTITIRPSN